MAREYFSVLAYFLLWDSSTHSMLCNYSNQLKTCKIVLGSNSPRRQQIFSENLCLNFEVVVSGFSEDIEKSSCDGAEDYVLKTSTKKTENIVKDIHASCGIEEAPDLIICADTIVVCDAEVFEKPPDLESARRMIQQLSGRAHEVMTAVTIGYKPGFATGVSGLIGNSYDYASFVEITDVYFAPISDSMIDAYLNSGEWKDKAGGYGIQGIGSSFVERISGCYFNVVGFPVHRFSRELVKLLHK